MQAPLLTSALHMVIFRSIRHLQEASATDGKGKFPCAPLCPPHCTGICPAENWGTGQTGIGGVVGKQVPGDRDSCIGRPGVVALCPAVYCDCDIYILKNYLKFCFVFVSYFIFLFILHMNHSSSLLSSHSPPPYLPSTPQKG